MTGSDPIHPLTLWLNQEAELDDLIDECIRRGEGILFIARYEDGTVQSEIVMRGVQAHAMPDQDHGRVVAHRYVTTGNRTQEYIRTAAYEALDEVS